MRCLLLFVTFTFLFAPVGAQENSLQQQSSCTEFSQWLEQRDPLWKEELFRLEVSGYPEADSLRATRQTITLKRRVLTRIENGPEAARLKGELEQLVQTLEQGLEEAFAPNDSSAKQFFSSIQ